MTDAADRVIFVEADGTAPDVAAGEAVLALPSRMCFSAGMPRIEEVGSARRRGRRSWRRTLLFDLEEKLPLVAEELTADFVAESDHVLGICVRTQQVAPLVDAVESAGCTVAAICPAALLALQTVLQDDALGEAPIVLIGEAEHLNLFIVENGQPRNWHLLPRAAADVTARLSLLMPDVGRTDVCAIGMSDVELHELEAAGLAIRVPPSPSLADLRTAATAAASEIVAARRRPIIDLRRDALAPADPLRTVQRPLHALVAAAALLLVALIGAWLIAAQRYDAVAANLHARQVDLFHELMPQATRVPPNIPRRLASEHRAMLSRTGSSDGLPTAGSALILMRDTFQRLPDDVPMRVEHVRLDDSGVELVGQVRSHQDAARLVEALGRDQRLRVEPARTHALRDRGVGFTIAARVAARAAALGTEGGP